MAGSVNKVILDLYSSGMSLPDVSKETGLSMSTVRLRVKEAGILRSRAEGIRLSGDKISNKLSGKKRPPFSEKWKNKISQSKLEQFDTTAKGYRITSNGYVEITRGVYKGNLLHRIVAEICLGRPLQDFEAVHHIDGDKTNNAPWNLLVMDKKEHVSMHRKKDYKNRKRDEYGRFA